MLDALALAPFVTGQQPYASTARLGEVRPGTALLPPGATVLRRAAEPDRESCLAAGDGWTIRVVRWHGGGATLAPMAILTERKTWAQPRAPSATRRSSDLTQAEQQNVRLVLRVLRARLGTIRAVAVSAFSWTANSPA